jgi:hypothetical protein
MHIRIVFKFLTIHIFELFHVPNISTRFSIYAVDRYQVVVSVDTEVVHNIFSLVDDMLERKIRNIIIQQLENCHNSGKCSIQMSKLASVQDLTMSRMQR